MASRMTAMATRRRAFRIFNRTFTIPSNRISRTLCIIATRVMDRCFYFLGIILIFFASGIASYLVYSFFTVLLPMISRAHAEDNYLPYFWPTFHILFVSFLLTNVVFNYVSCIMTRHDGVIHDKITRELADATEFVYPETKQDIIQFKGDFEHKIMIRLRRRRARTEEQQQQAQVQATNNQLQQSEQVPLVGNSSMDESSPAVTQRKVSEATSNATNNGNNRETRPQPVRRWMIIGPYEWSFCEHSYQPKPPRSHYCHVTKKLVLNMDHYCPWMFNCVGFLNYRYFYNFLLFVFISMMYGISLSMKPFLSIKGGLYREQARNFRQHGFTSPKHLYPYVPLPEERSPVSFTLLLCASVGLAVSALLMFHTYLLLTAQTTIEFHGNFANKRRAKREKKKFRNPYDVGLVRNFQQIYGTGSFFWNIILPSSREPEFLPVPIPGKENLRRKDIQNKEKIIQIKGPTIV